MSGNSNRINVFFSDEALASLKRIASERGLSVSAVVRMVVLEWLQKGARDGKGH